MPLGKNLSGWPSGRVGGVWYRVRDLSEGPRPYRHDRLASHMTGEPVRGSVRFHGRNLAAEVALKL